MKYRSTVVAMAMLTAIAVGEGAARAADMERIEIAPDHWTFRGADTHAPGASRPS